MVQSIHFLTNKGSTQSEIFIHSFIGESLFDTSGITSKKFIDELSQIPIENNILLHINSPGGSVHDGMAIYNALKMRKKKVKCQIDCLCGSIATIIMCAADKITMFKNGEVFIHKPSISGGGNADTLRKDANTLDMWEAHMLDIYNERTGLDKDLIAKMLQNETSMTAQEALDKHFIDEIIDAEASDREVALLTLNKIYHPERVDINNKIDMENMPNNKTPGAPAPTPDNGQDDIKNQLAEAKAELARFQLEATKAKKTRAQSLVDAAVKDGRVKNTDSEIWENMLLASESSEKILAGMAPQNLVGKVENDFITEIGGSYKQIGDELNNRKGSAKASLLLNKFDGLNGWVNSQVQNAITVPQTLRQDVIMGNVLREFKKRTGPLPKLFTTLFKNIPMAGTTTIQVPYFPSFTATPHRFYNIGQSPNAAVQKEGYGAYGCSYTLQSKPITLGDRLVVEMDWNSEQRNSTPYFTEMDFYGNLGASMAWFWWNEIQSTIVAANFPAKAFINDIAISEFNREKIAKIRLKCQKMDWDMMTLNMVLNSSFANELLCDPSVYNISVSNNPEVMRTGTLPQIYGFQFYDNVNVPDNGDTERLFGYVCLPTALGIINIPTMPDENIPTLYNQITDPDTGLILEGRFWGDAKGDVAHISVETHAGFGVLEPNALVRLTETQQSYEDRQLEEA